MDIYSSKINKAIDILFLSHPIRTSLGVLLGSGLFIMIRILEFSSPIINIWEFIILGILILHFRTIMHLIKKSCPFDEEIEKAFEIIKHAKKEGLPSWQIKQLYLKVCEKALSNIELKQKMKNEIEEIDKAK